MLFEGDLVRRFLAPLEGSGLGVVDLDKSIDGLAESDAGGEAGAVQDGPCQGVGEGETPLGTGYTSTDGILHGPTLCCMWSSKSAMAALRIPYPDWDRPNDIACRGLCHVVAWSSLAEGAGRRAL